jgi:hypothetical protein
MGIEKDFIALMKSEGYRVNETILDALDEFVGIVSDENETMQEDADTEQKVMMGED